MRKTIEAYLLRLDEGLSRLADADRERIVLEIRSHLAERDAAGDADAAIEALGPADRLARAFLEERAPAPRDPFPVPQLAAAAGIAAAAALMFLLAAGLAMIALLKLLFPDAIGSLWILPSPLVVPACLASAAGIGFGTHHLLAQGSRLFLEGPPGTPLQRRRRWRDGVRKTVVALLALAAAWGLWAGGALAWGSVTIAGERYKVSPVAIVHIIEPQSMHSPLVPCSWFPATRGETSLCRIAPHGEAAMAAVWISRPLSLAAALLALIAAALCLIRRERRRDPLLGLACIAGAGAGAASVIVYMTNIASALALVAEAGNLDYGGIGYRLMLMVTILLAIAGTLALTGRGAPGESRRNGTKPALARA